MWDIPTVFGLVAAVVVLGVPLAGFVYVMLKPPQY